MSRLTKFQKIKLLDGRTITAIGKLGEGGQGTVYRVSVDGTQEEKALKWYFAEGTDPYKLYDNLKQNIETGSPSSTFIWPEELTEEVNATFGYIMEIFPSEYKPFPKFLLAKVKFNSYSAVVNATLNIVVAFKALHNKGYNYQDLNDGNFVINPKTGDVLICDNDNVSGHGMSTGVLGKPRYMAPEVVRNEKMPDKLTDRYSLALILYMILIGDHPLEGAKTNVPVLTNTYDKKFFGIKPIFTFDDNLNENRPVEGRNKNAISFWPCYPNFIKNAFKKSFSQESLLQSKGRLLEQEWFHLLVQLKSSIIKCPHCSSEMFLDSSEHTACLDCKKVVSAIGYLRFTKRRSNIQITVPIHEGVQLYEYHMNESSEDYQTIAATVLIKPGKFGLENNSIHRWTVTSSEGKISTKEQGDVAVLGIGFKIDFGNGNIAEIISN